MVGFPNVGKSSVINSLIGAKRVSVGTLPGKTKHMQLIALSEDLTLCDCPGLVFPSAGSSFQEMVLNGVVSIDNLREYLSCVHLLAQRFPQAYLERRYNIAMEGPTGEHLLQGYGRMRGLTTGRGLPNEAFAARFILKDYVEGRLVWCSLPPGSSLPQQFACGEVPWQPLRLEDPPRQPVPAEEKDLDQQFFRATPFEKEDWSAEDCLQLLEGQRVRGLLLGKGARRELKFGLKRREDLRELMLKVIAVEAAEGRGQKGGHRKKMGDQ
jgi:large subunit GTPase 1